MTAIPSPMLTCANGCLRIQESCSLPHDFQVVETDFPCDPPEPVCFLCRDKQSGAHFPAQKSRQNPNRFFLGLALTAGETLELELSPEMPEKQLHSVNLINRNTHWEIGNGIIAIRIPASQDYQNPGPCAVPGPVAGIRFRNGRWFGETFFDTLKPVKKVRTEILESGPLRTVLRSRYDELSYSITFTLDAGQHFIKIEEVFHAEESDQVVWIFEREHLPETGYFLNQTPYYETRHLHYFIDTELAKLGPWTQQSQLTLSDGFAFRHPGEDTIFGVIALRGEEWKGNRLNSIDAWMRRLRKSNRLSRRLVPAWTKADAVPGPPSERIPERDRTECVPALCWEGWLGYGKRIWALAAATKAEFTPPGGDDLTSTEPPLSHFYEEELDLPHLLRQQGLFRKLHIQRGLYPLEKMLAQTFHALPGETVWSFRSGSDFMRYLIEPADPEADIHSEQFLAKMTRYIRARVASFWHGAGVISTNPVSSRRIAPLMFLTEELAKEKRIPEVLLHELRSKMLFLANLFHSQSCYAGYAAMLPPDDPDSFDPSLKGMANQNFYTDIINVYGTAAMLWPDHPCAKEWRKDFIAMLSRQLAVHVYPESGVWEESHTYFQHVLLTILPILKMLKERGDYNWFKDPSFKKLFSAALAQRGIPNGASENLRALTAFGDHDASVHPYRLLWHNYAACFAEEDPALAARLNWLGRESGGKTEDSLPIEAPELKSEHLAGLGVFFRGLAGDGSETLLAFRSGKAWAHHHQDDGSIQLFAHGQFLLGDAGCSGRTSGPLKLDDEGHSRWTVPGLKILNYHWRFNRGWITGKQLDQEPQYATAFSPAVMTLADEWNIPLKKELRHFRSVVRFNPETWLILDSGMEPADSVYHFHLGTTNLRKDAGRITAFFNGLNLELIPLSRAVLKEKGTVSGNEPHRNMITTHLAFEVPKTEPWSGFLIRFGENPSGENILPEVRMENGILDVEYNGQTLRLRHKP